MIVSVFSEAGNEPEIIDPKDAVGKEIRYYTWSREKLLVTRVNEKYVYGHIVEHNGIVKPHETYYSICEGIVKGGKSPDCWHIIGKYIDVKCSIEDDLFEI